MWTSCEERSPISNLLYSPRQLLLLWRPPKGGTYYVGTFHRQRAPRIIYRNLQNLTEAGEKRVGVWASGEDRHQSPTYRSRDTSNTTRYINHHHQQNPPKVWENPLGVLKNQELIDYQTLTGSNLRDTQHSLTSTLGKASKNLGSLRGRESNASLQPTVLITSSTTIARNLQRLGKPRGRLGRSGTSPVKEP